MARYGRDIDRGAWNRTYDAGYGAGGYPGGRGTYERGFEIGPTWGGGSDIGYRTGRARGYGYDRDLGDRMQEGWRGMQRGARRVFRGGPGRDWGDRLQEGWNETRRGAQRAFGGRHGRGYDRGW